MLPVSRQRRRAFTALAGFLVVVFGFVFFGLTSLAGWFGDLEGVAGPVTELGYGALVGLILTGGVASRLRGPERKIAGIQQAALVIPSMAAGSLLAWDHQNLEALVILVPALALLWALHPARAALLRPAARKSPRLAAIALLGAAPLIAYAVAMGAARVTVRFRGPAAGAPRDLPPPAWRRRPAANRAQRPTSAPG